jgi:uncharacterized protein YdeI (YjbR/CyaY-like superfamily)
VGFRRKASGVGGATYAEALDAALCYGWIDGVRRRVDEISYASRFTPRKPRSVWSAVNIARAEELERLGLMRPAGLAAFRARTDERSKIYSFEQAPAALEPAAEERFRANTHAWEFFSAQAQWYQRAAIWWVMSAKQEATRQRRLTTLIADSAAGRRLANFTYTPKG